MRSTSNNLLNLVYRLITSGIILFIVSEVVLAYVVAFYLIPSEKQLKMTAEPGQVMLGIEKTSQNFLFDKTKIPKTFTISRMSHAFDSCTAFKHGMVDAVLTDQLTASMLQAKYAAEPYAFIIDESHRKPLNERLILVTKSKKADFFEQTKGLKLVFSFPAGSLENIIFEEFLNDRTKDYKKWFSEVLTTDDEIDALNNVASGKVDVAAVSEVLYKEYLKKFSSNADILRVLWYSSPVVRKHYSY